MNDNQFKKIRESMNLSKEEKDFHRLQIVDFMKSYQSRRSPFVFMLKVKFFASVISMAVLAGAGVVYAAEDSLPSDTFYFVKTKISEPMAVILTIDLHKKVELEMDFINRRLAEAKAVQDTDVKDETIEVAVNKIDKIQKKISDLQIDQKPSEAMDLAIQLSATLHTHADVVSNDEIVETENMVKEAQEGVDDLTSEEVEELVLDQEDEIDRLIEKIDDPVSVEVVADIVEAAEEKQQIGDVKSAYKLYNDAEQKIHEVRTRAETEDILN